MTGNLRAAVLTPAGTAAIATIAVVGPLAWQIVGAAFRRANGQALPANPDASRLWNGKLGPPPGDDVVLTVRRTGPTPWIEVHCHGGEHVVRWLLDDLRTHGAETCPADDLLGEMESTPLRAAAARELMHAVTPRTAAILLDQYHGAFEAGLADIDADLVAGAVDSATKRMDELRRYASLGRHLVRPWKVVVAGAPNVGKSSLVNRIVGYSRCVVTPIPGTTRDAVSTAIAIDGWPVELIDTAGHRPTFDLLEKTGIELAREATARADLMLWVLDATEPIVKGPAGSIVVWNKIDLAPDAEVPTGAAPASAETGAGIEQLLSVLSQRIVPVPPPAGRRIPFSAPVAERIESIANQMTEASVSETVMALRTLRTSGR